MESPCGGRDDLFITPVGGPRERSSFVETLGCTRAHRCDRARSRSVRGRQQQDHSVGHRCGTEMVNDTKVKAVLSGVLIVGGESLYKVVVPKLPVIVGNPVTNPDFLTKGIDAFTPGSPGVIQGLAVFIVQNLNTAKPV